MPGKHRNEVSGGEINLKKRRRSSNKDIENKRGRLGRLSGLDSSSSSDSTTSEGEDSIMADNDDSQGLLTFVRHMKAALADKDIEKMLLKPTLVVIEKMDSRMEKVEKETHENKQEIVEMNERLDEIEQRERSANMIITVADTPGIEASKTTVTKLLNDKLKTNIQENEINYVLKLGNNDTKPTKMRVVFHDKDRKKDVMKKKKNLKGKKIWLSDDLTPYRSNLAFLARKACKDKKIHDTWVTDSKIFIQTNAKDTPKKIRTAKDLPN